MKTRSYILFFLLLCLSQVLHAQGTLLPPLEPIEPYEKLDAGASVTRKLVYHDSGENTANHYRFLTMKPLLVCFEFSDFAYSRGWGDPLPQATIVLDAHLEGDGPGFLPRLFIPGVDGRTGQFLPSSGGTSMELPAGNYQFTFTGHHVNGGLASLSQDASASRDSLSSRAALSSQATLSSQAVAPFTVEVPPPTYFFNLHITTATPPAPVEPDPEPDDAVLPAIPPIDIHPLVNLPAPGNLNSICSFSSSSGNATEGILTVNYADDLGREVETARTGHAGQSSNLVSLQEYDPWGRKGNTWLEAAKDTTAGAYVSPAQCRSLASRTNSGDSRPYTETVYEASPLNRPIKQYGPGQDWYSKGKAVNTVYASNSMGAGVLGCRNFAVATRPVAEMTVTSSGYYAAGSLRMVKTTDEDGKAQWTFTDRSGKTVLVRQMEQKGTSQVLYDTYYMYDGAGNLLCVLPPELSAKAPMTGILPKAELDKYAYLYSYDSFYRLSQRKLPGSDWEGFLYDDDDRLVASQDGNLRKEGKWRFMIADKLGRVCLEGVCTSCLFIIDMQHTDSHASCEYIGKKGAHHGYALNGVSLGSPVFQKVSYYDNYRFLDDGLLPAGMVKDSLAYAPRSGYGVKSVSAKGNLTGVLTGQTGGLTGLSGSAFYYDFRARLIQSHSGNHLNGVDSEYTSYNFNGQPLKRLHVHSVPGKAALSELYTYTYDAAGLPLTTHHRLGSGAEMTLSNKSYDALGRLSAERRNGFSTLHSAYTYNVRSWLTGVLGQRFSQTLSYNADGLNSTKCYNGNISGMTWKSGNEGTLRNYIFLYDPLNRLQDAVYSEGGSGFGNLNGFTEQVTGYDKNGNILGLKRYGQTGASSYGLIDNLTLKLNGNQLVSVTDAVTASAYNNGFEFKDGARLASEYAYDLNGNLTKDLNKNISSIEYNYLNLPYRVSFSDGSTLTYAYDGDGVKLRTVHKIGGSTTTTDYCGNVIYENGMVRQLLSEGGYLSLSDKKYHYYLQDHQGNNRVVVDSSGKVEETNHYYPFGGIFSSTGNVQAYKYNGKELDVKKGLNWYDYGARMYDAVLGRFTTIDPMVEKYYKLGSYVYCANNPVNLTDPTGMWITHKDSIGTYRYNNGQWEQYQTEGENAGQYIAYTPVKGSFLAGVLSGLNQLGKNVTGKEILDFFANDENNATLRPGSKNEINLLSLASGKITLKSDFTGSKIPTLDGLQMSPFWLDIGHELAHRQDVIQNGIEQAGKVWLTADGKTMYETEKYATHMENLMRADAGLPLRTHYATQGNAGWEPSRILNPNSRVSTFYGTAYRTLPRLQRPPVVMPKLRILK